MSSTACDTVLMPNPSLKRSANGRLPGPVWQYAVHFRQPCLGKNRGQTRFNLFQFFFPIPE